MSQSPSIALSVSVAMDTDAGRKRKQNQDAIGHLIPTDPVILESLGRIFVLADGVGGLTGGDLASQYAVSTIISSYYDQTEGEPPERLARAIAEANSVIYAEGQGQPTPSIMATTVVAAVIRDRELIIGSVGDSPAYLMRDAEPRQLTLDHTVEVMQREAGTPLPEGDPSGRKLVRALGSAQSVKVDIISGPVRGGDHVVLCSDGLTRYVVPQEIEGTVATLAPDRAVKALIQMANERGGADNISVIVLRLEDSADPALDLAVDFDAAETTWDEPDYTRMHEPPALKPTSRVRERRRERQRAKLPTLPPDNPLWDLWRFLRGNTVATGAGLGVLLVLFVIIMLIVFSAGDDKPDKEQAAATSVPDTAATATAALHVAATAQAAAIQTNTAMQAAEATRTILLTLTPPTPMPTSGPQMVEGVWFQVLDGQPIPTYTDHSIDSTQATELDPGSNYRVTAVNGEANFGPWYQVIDNLGQESRWVNGPSLHQRIVVVDTAGNPLPDSEQPVDVPPPGQARPAATQTPVRATVSPEAATTATPEQSGTQGTQPTTPSPSPEPTISYGVEGWTPGSFVRMKADLELREMPSVDATVAGEAALDEVGTVVAGPVAAGEHWWWQIEFADQRKGWIAQVLLGAP